MKSSNIAKNFLKNKPKERIDMILEPMQAMIQIALLSFCPEGTKLSVRANLLHLQWPSFSQGILRWMNKDSKEDLYFLFNVFRRYYKWYKKEDNKIFKYILELSKKGLEKIIRTYQNSGNHSIIQNLEIYRSILNSDNHELFQVDDNEITIDCVFRTITKLYSMKFLLIVYNTLRLMEDEKDKKRQMYYFKGLQEIMIPLQEKIRTWILENLIS